MFSKNMLIEIINQFIQMIEDGLSKQFSFLRKPKIFPTYVVFSANQNYF